LNAEVLIVELKKGNEVAFRQLFDEYYPLLVTVADGYLYDRQTAEEIADDVMFHIWEIHGSLEIHTSFKHYLVQAVYNRCVNQIKSIKKKPNNPRNQLLINDSNYHELAKIDSLYPPSQLITDELDTLIKRSIDELPPQCKKVFQLSRFKEMSYQEIAKELEISVNTVKTQLKLAIKKLRTNLHDYLTILIIIILQLFS